jgi:hypothetical protein
MSQTLEQIADAFEAAGYTSPFATDYAKRIEWQNANPGKDVGFNDFDADKFMQIDATDLPSDWKSLVHGIMNKRRTDALEAAANAEFAKLPQAFQLAAESHRRKRTYKPETRDLSSLGELATDKRDTKYGRGMYKADPKCSLRLKLKNAVQIGYEQESYADYARYLIPVEGERPTDLSACRRNLGTFCEALCTTNGLAGFGSSWEMELIDTSAGLVVMAVSRSSISD